MEENSSLNKIESDYLKLRAVIRGRVQGVGYRQFVVMEANRLKIGGWVRNDPLDRNRVEVEAEGTQLKLEELLKKLWEGPFGAKVNEIATQWSTGNQVLDNFQIR